MVSFRGGGAKGGNCPPGYCVPPLEVIGGTMFLSVYSQLVTLTTVYDLCLAVILIWHFGGVVPEPPIIMSVNNNAETAPWPCFYKFSVAAGLNRQC